MTLYKRLNEAVPRTQPQVNVIEAIVPDSEPIEVAKHSYVYRETVVSHMPIFLYLQQNNVEVPQNHLQKQKNFMSNLEDLFPTISRQCGSCGSFSNNYRDHLQAIVSIHQVGRKTLRHIRLNGSNKCFEHYTLETDTWTLIKTSRHLKNLAGFI